MKRLFQNRILLFGLTLVSIGNVTNASADVAPVSEIVNLLQDGPDVRIRTALSGTPDDTVVLKREQNDKTVIIAETAVKDAEKQVAYTCEPSWEGGIPVAPLCENHPLDCHDCEDAGSYICVGKSCDDCKPALEENGYFYPDDLDAFCETYPEYNLDCDQDGTGDCCMGTCEETKYTDFWDRCVPPGKTTYRLEEYGEWDMAVIDVEEKDACQTDVPTDSSDDEDTEGSTKAADSQGCRTVGAGAEAHLYGFFAIVSTLLL